MWVLLYKAIYFTDCRAQPMKYLVWGCDCKIPGMLVITWQLLMCHPPLVILCKANKPTPLLLWSNKMWPDLRKGPTLRNFECIDFNATYLHNTVRDLKLNMGGLYRGRCCSNEPEMKPFSSTTMTIWAGVNSTVNRGAISRQWQCYQGACLGSGES